MMYHIGICDDDKNMCVVTSQGEKEFYGKLKDVLYKLPLHFIQIHKSFIVYNTAMNAAIRKWKKSGRN